jgi:Uncharacterized conserved protein related to dihydrodipicolinate reductase
LNFGVYGFGSIGRLIARVALERGFSLVGVVDVDPSIVGRDAGEVLGLGEKLGVRVSSDVSSLRGSDVVFHATGSYLDRVYRQILDVVGMVSDVISTCETLAYPYYRYPVLARLLDEKARLRGVAILGTGINPGFLLDTLLITLSSSIPVVRSVRAVRSLDAAKRREPFRRKIGVGEKPEVVEAKLRSGELTGHVGYAESVLLVADASGINLTGIVEEQRPVVAESDIESHGVKVGKGYNMGIIGYGSGYVKDREVIRVEFKAYVGAPEYEEIVIEGPDKSVTWRSNGTPGDAGTAAVVVSLAEKIKAYGPGLLTMADLLPFRPFIKYDVDSPLRTPP